MRVNFFLGAFPLVGVEWCSVCRPFYLSPPAARALRGLPAGPRRRVRRKRDAYAPGVRGRAFSLEGEDRGGTRGVEQRKVGVTLTARGGADYTGGRRQRGCFFTS